MSSKYTLSVIFFSMVVSFALGLISYRHPVGDLAAFVASIEIGLFVSKVARK